jgi:hypothetical protein
MFYKLVPRSVIRQHAKYWPCLKYGVALPDQILPEEHPVVLPEASTSVSAAECKAKDSPYIPFQVIMNTPNHFNRLKLQS